jgi:DNA (cytosine-5)-methyltransferase 1
MTMCAPEVTNDWQYYELFAGGGAARLGLGPGRTCTLANDISQKKGNAYAANFGREWPGGILKVCDVAKLTTRDLPGRADLCWMSPPCVGHSEAGAKRGFNEEESRAFWPAWALIEALAAEGRAPKTVVFENVSGIRPENLALVQAAFSRAGYRHATRVIDAAHFVPQNRERVFVVGAHQDLGIDPEPYFDRAMQALPKERGVALADVLDLASNFREYSPAMVAHQLTMLSPASIKLVAAARALGRPVAYPFARRTRDVKTNGVVVRKEQRVEARRDGVTNALKVASKGGSNHQFVMTVHGAETRIRAINPREAARLMGLPDSYVLPENPIGALDLCGDGVVVPVVRHIAEHVIEPLLAGAASRAVVAATVGARTAETALG